LATGYLILLEVAAICHYKDCDKEKDKEKEMREMKWKDNQGHTFELDDKEVEIIAQRAVFLDNPDGTSEVKNFSPVVPHGLSCLRFIQHSTIQQRRNK